VIVSEIKIKISFHPLNGLPDWLELNRAISVNTAAFSMLPETKSAPLGI